MKCWVLCSLGIAVLVGASMSSAAQQPAKVFHIGILSPAASSSTKAFDAFLQPGLTTAIFWAAGRIG